ncbi:imidazole glycerol phosphate synthase subunit HisH [Thermodesulfobacteriota bacterium]
MIAIIDYNAGNLTSVQRALRFLGRESIITGDSIEITNADRIIFPGVGAAGKAMSDLKRLNIDQALLEAFDKGVPILGICLGTQIIMEWSQENDTACLGIIKGDVHRFSENMQDAEGKGLKVPHMGWNSVNLKSRHPLFEGVDPGSEFYFVHAYYPTPQDSKSVLGETEYGICFASVLKTANLVAVQFHLEKSGRPGLKVLSNFCEWNGAGHAE